MKGQGHGDPLSIAEVLYRDFPDLARQFLPAQPRRLDLADLQLLDAVIAGTRNGPRCNGHQGPSV